MAKAAAQVSSHVSGAFDAAQWDLELAVETGGSRGHTHEFAGERLLQNLPRERPLLIRLHEYLGNARLGIVPRDGEGVRDERRAEGEEAEL
jgi:hypothetical protein